MRRAASRRRERKIYRPIFSSVAVSFVVILIAGGSAILARSPGRLSVAAASHTGAHPPAAPASSARAKAPAPPPNWRVVALGDSVPAGTACGCVPFPMLYAQQLVLHYHVEATATDLGVPGLTSAGLLAALGANASWREQIAAANVVAIEIGANDFSYDSYTQGDCARLSCYAPGLAMLASRLREIVDDVIELRGRQPTAVRLVDYWDIWLDGAVGRRYGAQYMSVGYALTAQVNRLIQAVAAETGVGFVDLYQPFHAGNRAVTNLLASDGNHPNAAGHALIAQQLLASGVSPLTPSG